MIGMYFVFIFYFDIIFYSYMNR